MTSAKFLWLLRDFIPEYHHAKFGCNWTTNKGETEQQKTQHNAPPAYMIPKDPSLNRVKDTSHFLQYIEDLNTSEGPFDANSTLLIRRDIANFYLSCDTEKCLQAVEDRFNLEPFKSPSTKCILEALKITMTSNSAEFDSRSFTQIDGATIGSPDSGIVIDIFGAIYIDNVME